MAGRRPVPDEIKNLTGSKNPRNGNAPKYTYLTLESIPVPKDVQKDAYALEHFNFVAPELINNRMLCRANLRLFANYCMNIAYMQHAQDDVDELGRFFDVPVTNKKGEIVGYKKVSNTAIMQANAFRLAALRYAVEFGLTPAAQTRVFALPGGEDEPAQSFAQFTEEVEEDIDGSFAN